LGGNRKIERPIKNNEVGKVFFFHGEKMRFQKHRGRCPAWLSNNSKEIERVGSGRAIGVREKLWDSGNDWGEALGNEVNQPVILIEKDL